MSDPSCRTLVTVLVLAGLAVSPALARNEWYDHYEQAIAALAEGEPTRAADLLEQALRRKKRTGYVRTYGNNYLRYVPHYYLGVAWHDAGDCDRALESFDRSQEAGETDPEPALASRMQALIASCEAKLNPPPEPPPPAVEPEPEAVALDPEPAPDVPPLRIERARLEAGLRAWLDGDLEQAVARFDALAEAEPRSARLRLLQGMALHGAWSAGGREPPELLERARAALREARRIEPGLVPDPALCPPPVLALYRSLR